MILLRPLHSLLPLHQLLALLMELLLPPLGEPPVRKLTGGGTSAGFISGCWSAAASRPFSGGASTFEPLQMMVMQIIIISIMAKSIKDNIIKSTKSSSRFLDTVCPGPPPCTVGMPGEPLSTLPRVLELCSQGAHSQLHNGSVLNCCRLLSHYTFAMVHSHSWAQNDACRRNSHTLWGTKSTGVHISIIRDINSVVGIHAPAPVIFMGFLNHCI